MDEKPDFFQYHPRRKYPRLMIRFPGATKENIPSDCGKPANCFSCPCPGKARRKQERGYDEKGNIGFYISCSPDLIEVDTPRHLIKPKDQPPAPNTEGR